jgi:hypothetical protein
VEIASPDGGPRQGDSWSDPRDESEYDLITDQQQYSRAAAARLIIGALGT